MRHLYTQATLRPFLIASCCALLGGLLAAAAGIFAVDPDLTAPRIWRGYYTLLVEASEDNARLARDLALRPGIQAVVSRHTAEVSFNTFGGFGNTTVSAIDERLDPGDPRRDAYMAGIDALFRVPGQHVEWEAIYLRTDLARLPMLATLSAAPTGRRWAVVDVSPIRTVLRLALFLAFAVVLVLRSGSWSAAAPLSVGLIPWLAAVGTGTGTTLLFCFLAVPVWAELLESFRRYVSRSGAGAPAPRTGRVSNRQASLARAGTVVLGLSAAALLIGGGTAPLPVLLPLLAGILAFPFAYALEVQRSLGHFHRVFEAVPILKGLGRRHPWLTRRRVWNLALVVVAVAALPVVGEGPGRSDLPYYAPAAIGGVREPLSWAGLSRLAAAAGSGPRLPNLADYLSHRAYQEALSFGRPYGLPQPGERVRISQYREALDGPEILRTERVVKRFQESWLKETLGAVPAGSVERLLVDQGFAALVLPGGEGVDRPSLSRQPARGLRALAALAVGLFLAAYLLGRDFRLTPEALCVTTSLTLRRHQHPS